MKKAILVPAQTVHDELMQNPKLKRLWEERTEERALAQSIIAQRIQQNLTQEELAQRAGINRPSLTRVETGSTSPSVTTLKKIARAFGKRLEIQFV
jgi:DNA-binding XRE family transcriptional regulator